MSFESRNIPASGNWVAFCRMLVSLFGVSESFPEKNQIEIQIEFRPFDFID